MGNTGNLYTIDRILDALPSGVAIAVFPELCVTGYDLDIAKKRAISVPSELTDRLVHIAAEHDSARALNGPYYVAGSNHIGEQHGRITQAMVSSLTSSARCS